MITETTRLGWPMIFYCQCGENRLTRKLTDEELTPTPRHMTRARALLTLGYRQIGKRTWRIGDAILRVTIRQHRALVIERRARSAS